MSRPDIGAGDVVINLDGEEVTLRPTLEACTTLSRIQGGIHAQVQRCLALEFDAILAVIVAGLGMRGNGSKDLPGKVFKSGLIQLSAPCISFLHIVANGGRPLGEDQEEESSPLELNSSQ